VVDRHLVALALLELPVAEAVKLREDASELMGVLDVDGVKYDASLLAAYSGTRERGR
jgi:hypothetical protein